MSNPVTRSGWLRASLAPLSLAYRGVIGLRNAYYDHVPSAVYSAGVPVISVGNLTVGGTGKTPLTIEIVARLLALGRRPAVLTRGYGTTVREVADEVLEYGLAHPEVPVVVNPDRRAGAVAACRDHGADCLVLDDGFQHRRLRRDLDVVLIDALEPWGGGWLLPAGGLREPLASLRRAGWIVVTRSNQVAPDVLDRVLDVLRARAPEVPVSKAAVEAHRLVGMSGSVWPLADLAERAVLPVCGIGNPATFSRLLEQLGARGCTPLVFPDHHRYDAGDVEAIFAGAARGKASWVVTTRKDWVKLNAAWPSAPAGSGMPDLVRLEARLTLADPRGAFDARLRRLFEEHA